ncbi:hypothetical protein M8494_29035 [Serratia ureilytica]
MTQALRQFSRQHGGTLFMTVLAAWSLVLARMAAAELVIGTPRPTVAGWKPNRWLASSSARWPCASIFATIRICRR